MLHHKLAIISRLLCLSAQELPSRQTPGSFQNSCALRRPPLATFPPPCRHYWCPVCGLLLFVVVFVPLPQQLLGSFLPVCLRTAAIPLIKSSPRPLMGFLVNLDQCNQITGSCLCQTQPRHTFVQPLLCNIELEIHRRKNKK